MSKREKRLLIILGILAVVTAVYYLSGMTGGPEVDELGLSVAASERIADLSNELADMPTLDIAQLNEEKASFTGTTRNIFLYGDSRLADNSDAETQSVEPDEEDVETVATLDEPPVTNVEETERKPQQRQLAGYELLGLIVSEDDVKTAVFSWRNQTFTGSTGDTINDTFTIKEIAPKHVLIHVLSGDFEQRLRLNNPSNSRAGGR